jgi:activator of HSP90 ATPase
VGHMAAALPLVATRAPWRPSAVAHRDGGPDDGISRTAESIHQVVTFQTTPARVYDALMVPEQFAKVTGQTTQIGPEPGGAFSLFGGMIEGRHVELVPDKRIVQAWRVHAWPAGVYSIVRFELTAAGAGTRLEFDHTGFPPGAAEHLASGWKQNYWTPLTKYFASP